MVSKSQPTVPSPPQQMTLKLATSLNICRPASDPPCSRLYTCRGLRRDWNLRRMRAPCLPPDFGLMNTKSGHMPGWRLIWKDIGDPDDPDCCLKWNVNHYRKEKWIFFFKFFEWIFFTSEMGRWLSERVRDRRSRQVDTCRSRTIGHMDVGGRMWTRCSPKEHSGFTWEAHRLCNLNLKMQNIQMRILSKIGDYLLKYRHLTPAAM